MILPAFIIEELQKNKISQNSDNLDELTILRYEDEPEIGKATDKSSPVNIENPDSVDFFI
ncbi:MAG: hypothetical protein JXR91_05525 [Deltaproteobacteria bacterium]|nr:hypothetical protein [Deltaproteobacteria bacterium]